VGENYFPGYPGLFKDDRLFVTFFALDYNQGEGTKIFIQAVDAAENKTVSGLPHYIIKKTFRNDVINISDRFLASKMPEFANELPPGMTASPVEIFLKVNRDLRQANYDRLKEFVKNPDTALHWKGRFTRLPNSARRAGFADHRLYRYNDKDIDRQMHLGIDLASTARSPIPAANTGKVVFADGLGIYGNTILLDHGFGLYSMYAHLSEIGVKKGLQVQKGDVIGRTGSSGLAGGDHLHFSILIHHVFVNPIEWWDASWIENNILSKIRDAESG
jgi:murein DD-endopeptidase MepM/ murein hydrolase activator NlpD